MKAAQTVLIAGTVLGALMKTSAMAQSYPTAPIHVTVPFPAGALDIFPRFIQPGMEKDLGQPLIIEIKPGASGFIGTEFVARSAPDGYNVLFTSTSSVVTGPLVSADAKFDVERDFTPIAGLVGGSWALIVRSGLPVNNLAEFVAYTKANPGKVNYASSGLGSLPHVLGETLARAMGAQMIHVPYRGFPPALQAMSGGEVDSMIMAVGFARPLLVKGDAKILAYDGVPMPSDMPTVPDLTKAVPGFETLEAPAGFFAPAKTPKAIVDRLNKAIRVGAAPPDVREKLLVAGQNIIIGSPEEFGTVISNNIAASKRVIGALKAAGVKFE